MKKKKSYLGKALLLIHIAVKALIKARVPTITIFKGNAMPTAASLIATLGSNPSLIAGLSAGWSSINAATGGLTL